MTAIKILHNDSNSCEIESGAYVLRMRVAAPLSLLFGRFQGGRPIAVPPGEALYVGSAMGKRGASTLARRLLRHATRTNPQPPHVIRDTLLARLHDADMGGVNLQSPCAKTRRWHIDYLLDQPDVEVTHILAIRSSKRLETALAHYLNADAHTTSIAPGLGASDSPGTTHLLRLNAPPVWWPEMIDHIGRRFPAEI